MSYPMVLLAAQAAGTSLDLWQTSQANKMVGLGAKLDNQALDLRLQQETLANTEQALMNSEKLRSVLASQTAIMAARGQMGGQGTAGSITDTSVRNFSADERARALNFDMRKGQITAQKYLNSINAKATQAQNSYGLFGRLFDQTSPNSIINQMQPLSTPNLFSTEWKSN